MPPFRKNCKTIYPILNSYQRKPLMSFGEEALFKNRFSEIS